MIKTVEPNQLSMASGVDFMIDSKDMERSEVWNHIFYLLEKVKIVNSDIIFPYRKCYKYLRI